MLHKGLCITPVGIEKVPAGLHITPTGVQNIPAGIHITPVGIANVPPDNNLHLRLKIAYKSIKSVTIN